MAEVVDVAGAEGEDEVAVAQARGEEALGVVERRHPDTTGRAGVGGRLGDAQPGDAGEVLLALAGRVDAGDDGEVGRGQRAAEARRLGLRAREEVGLEDGDDPARALASRAAAIVAATSVGWWA